MRIGRNEIIAELTEHIRQCGGEMGEWCALRPKAGFGRRGVGTTTDAKLQIQSSRETTAHMPELAYREAHTPYAAADAVDYLISSFGLRPAPGSAPGKMVFVYRRPRGADVAASSPLHAAA